MAGKSVSFRTHLHSNALDLIRGIGLHCARTAQLIAGIVSQLAAYTEEGVPLAPSVFICNSISRLVQQAGTGEHIVLAENELLDHSASKILKAAAGLCGDNWRIYVERSPDGIHCSYGVFCGSTDPSSMTVDEIVLSDFTQDYPIIRILQSSTNKVEVRTNAGGSVEFRFNDDVDVEDLDNKEKVKDLSKIISREATVHADVFQGLIERLLISALRKCHGTLIAVTETGDIALPPELADVVTVSPIIDLHKRLVGHMDEGKTAISVSALQSASDLVAGFIGSDGITIFNSNGAVIGYRAFIRGDAVAAPGGARSRAYAALVQLVGNGLKAAFFRSQDGRTELHKSEEAARDE